MDCSDQSSRSEPQQLSRGELLKRAGILGAAAAVPLAGTAEPALAQEELAHLRQLKALAPSDATTIAAVVERLIPTDATGPGAREANVIRYIDRSLAGDLSMFRPSYTAAVVAIDSYSTSKYGAPFAALSTGQQDAVLTDMDLNRATGFAPTAKAVFEMIRTHAVQGMFGDPAHGGNVNFVGWKLVRFPGPRLVIAAKDQAVNAVPKGNMQSTYSIPLFKSRTAGRG
jgi:gluconate 2-dehydrogenase gamma chain